MLSSRKGQAIVELLPSMIIFVIVLSAGLAYFQVMRAAALRQEAVRNLAFAKIANMGTLTTPPAQMRDGVHLFGDRVPASQLSANEGQIFDLRALGQSRYGRCFMVFPGGGNGVSIPRVSIVAPSFNLSIPAYATVYRSEEVDSNCPL